MISRSYPGSELLNQIDNNGNIVGVPPRSHAERHNEIDVGYDTDTIAIFEIDKAFTDYLLCQICFSKSTLSPKATFFLSFLFQSGDLIFLSNLL